MSDERGPEQLLAERPELASALESVLVVDDEHDGWTFEDVDIDSGTFGELVSRDIVEKDGDIYRVADRAAVRAALGEESTTADDGGGFDISVDLPTVDGPSLGLLGAALLVVVLARTYVVGTIYRSGDIVLSGNDPYYYRYWVEQVTAQAGSGFDFGALSLLPDGVLKGEPLLVATLWWLSELFGGTVASVGHVLAWYPVVSAVVSAVLVYLLAVRVTDDRRVGLASVLFLAIVPGHALRTSLGYADHHAFDYPWLGLSALALLLVVTTARNRAALRTVTPWAGGLGLAVGLTGQILSWEAGPLLVVPVGLTVAAKTFLDVEAGRSPLVANAPIVGATGVAAGLVWLVHSSWGWHTDLVALTPLLLFVGTVGVVATATAVRRLGGDVRYLAGVDAVGAVLAVVLVRQVFTERWNEAIARTDLLFRSDAIAETYGLFNPGTIGFLLLFGFVLVMALPVMVLGLRRAVDGRADWLVVSAYAWYFFALATIQVRFVGELATFAALFAGYAFVWLASKVDLARPLAPAEAIERMRVTVPEPRTLASLGVLFLLVGSLGLVQVPVKTSQITIGDGVYGTAVAIEDDTAQQNLEYPENYVLSQWGQSRVYNYFVNGESRSYGYARATYANFSRGTEEGAWYDRLRGRVGYVVTENLSATGPETMQTRLHDHYGSQSEGADGLGHYRAVYVTEGGSHKAFQLVPGAVIEGTAAPDTTVTATTAVTISNAEFDYTRESAVPANGSYSLRVANSGSYTVETANGTQTVDVTEGAVRNGTTVTVGN